MLNNLLALAKDVIPNLDWKGAMGRSALVRQLIRRPELWTLVNAALAMRDPLADALFQTGAITEEEAAPVKDGGLGLIELVKLAVDKEGEEDGDGDDAADN